jgi:hypothetical protein
MQPCQTITAFKKVYDIAVFPCQLCHDENAKISSYIAVHDHFSKNGVNELAPVKFIHSHAPISRLRGAGARTWHELLSNFFVGKSPDQSDLAIQVPDLPKCKKTDDSEALSTNRLRLAVRRDINSPFGAFRVL